MTTPTVHARSRRLTPARWAAMATAAAVLTALAACNNDDPDPGEDAEQAAGRDEPTTSTSTTTTTQPPASDEEAAYLIIEDMVLEATALADQLFQDPTVVNDPDNPDIERLKELYTDDSPTPGGVLDQLHDLADKGQRVRASPESGVYRDLGAYQMTPLDDDTVRFRICASEDTETLDENDSVVDRRARVIQGVGEARRVDGIWRFYGINMEDDRTLEIEPGTANPGFCDSLFGEQDDT